MFSSESTAVVNALEFAIDVVAPIVWLFKLCGQMKDEKRKKQEVSKMRNERRETDFNFIVYLLYRFPSSRE